MDGPLLLAASANRGGVAWSSSLFRSGQSFFRSPSCLHLKQRRLSLVVLTDHVHDILAMLSCRLVLFRYHLCPHYLLVSLLERVRTIDVTFHHERVGPGPRT